MTALVKHSLEERQVAKQALAALTRLKQGNNPFKDGAIAQMENDKVTFERCVELLNIPMDYTNNMLNILQKIYRAEI